MIESITPLNCPINEPQCQQSSPDNSPAGVPTQSLPLARNHICFSSPPEHSRNVTVNPLLPLASRSGGSGTRFHKKQHFWCFHETELVKKHHVFCSYVSALLGWVIGSPLHCPEHDKSKNKNKRKKIERRFKGNLRGVSGENTPNADHWPENDIKQGEGETIANPRARTSLGECTDWLRLIQLSADSGRNITRSLANTNQSGWAKFKSPFYNVSTFIKVKHKYKCLLSVLSANWSLC